MRTNPLIPALSLAALVPAQWNRATPAAAPAARIEPAMAFDGAANTTLLFGGVNLGSFQPVNHADTWTWNGTNWTQRSPATSPPARFFAGMCYDPVRARTVLYGGNSATLIQTGYKNDTWEWNGTTWTQVTTANTPGGYFGNNNGVGQLCLAYDLLGQRVVMFGGELFQGIVPAPNLTLEYDGVNWTQASTNTAPPPRAQASMCTATSLGGVLLFGGTNFNNPPGPNQEIVYNDLWVYAASTHTWTQLQPSGTLPRARAGASLLFDQNRGVYVLFGGYDSTQSGTTPLADTWTFDGTAWTDVTATYGSPTSPLLRFSTADGPNGCHVLFGGSGAFFGQPRQETWIQGACAGIAAYGAGCAGSGGTPSLAATTPPVLGTTYTLAAGNLAAAASIAFLTTGFSNTNSPLGPLPLSLQQFGLGAGCTLLSSAEVTSLFAVAAGTGSKSLSLPANPAFAGMLWFHQVGSIDPLATGSLTVSNGVRATIGF